ncbi:D-alanyl-D-alanine carboxypeptidase/D-alanyl-D-alanine endopeptidase [Ferruginibacter sp. SUN106]|uniref:D-alanyl-D-alanine carboxypeptidase/D-alanyl-D-alanine endopeptidase n=1 Tax=Ferruginibacter sp. SUN106 TaxID=2978348 RepID=UPI003D36939E
MKWLMITLLVCICSNIQAQNIDARLTAAIKGLENDAQFKHAILSMYVVDSKTGKVIFDRNAQIGLAPASCQKVVTSVSAFELLGKEYKYKTDIGYSGKIVDTLITGDIHIVGYGDPTLGSWRYNSTTPEGFFTAMTQFLRKKNIRSFKSIVVDDTKWGSQSIPDGWVWEDIGNYYGAGASSFNWNENQYSIILQSGQKVGDKVKVVSSDLGRYHKWINELKTAERGTGDNAYIYLGSNSKLNVLRGTIPLSEKTFTISGAQQNGFNLFVNDFRERALKINLDYSFIEVDGETNFISHLPREIGFDSLLYTYYSPTLDSINYWFLKKSVNLYGEAFVKTIAYEKTKSGSTDTGIAIIKDFWNKNGIEKSALNIIDGSGLSPANRVTTNALVTVMQYAQKQKWFASFYYDLPEINGIKMKDGYINGVRSYTGYVKSRSGEEYTFSFIVNNFDGNPGTVREKMWKVLDILK